MHNLEEKRFGRVTVVRNTGKRLRKYIVWECLCDCGRLCERVTSDLTLERLQSCGCLLRDAKLKTAPGEYGFNKKYRDYSLSAKARQLSFSLTKEEFKKLSQQNCHYCGVEPVSICVPNWKNSTVEAIENSKFIYNGLDRVDNFKGYDLDNVVTCCETCNRAKLALSREEFILLANRIAKQHPLEDLSGTIEVHSRFRRVGTSEKRKTKCQPQ